jgi:ribonuclease P protein component
MPTALEVAPLDAPRPQLWRIRERRAFVDLRRHGRRVRRGPLTVTWLPGPDDRPPQAAYAVGRPGGSVTRNRVRRRLRAALRELQAAERLPSGTYLVGGSAALADLPWTELLELLRSAVDEVTA